MLTAGLKQAFQQDFVYPTAEAFLTVNHYDRHTRVIAFAKRWIGVDIDRCRLQTVFPKQIGCIIAEVATLARVEDNLRSLHSCTFLNWLRT